jgi:hypothetical protein
LLDHLRAEEDLLRSALDSLTALNAALRRGDIAAVGGARPQQEALAAALVESHSARAAVAAALAGAVGLPPYGLTLSAVADRLPENAAVELRAARDRLAALAAGVRGVQLRNANLIHNLRSYFRGVLAAFTAADAPARYGPGGEQVTPAAGGVLRARG